MIQRDKGTMNKIRQTTKVRNKLFTMPEEDIDLPKDGIFTIDSKPLIRLK